MCHFDMQLGGPKICDAAGDMPACALCRVSPNYWRDTHAPAVADPYDNTPKIPVPDLDMTGWRDDREPPPADQHDRIRYLAAIRCVLCNLPTTWISPKGTRCHPSCATMWARQHARPTTPAA